MHTLENFIEKLKSRGDILEVDEYFSPDLEMTELSDRMMKLSGGGKAILFKNTGTEYPVVINLFGSEKRISEALYCNDTKEKSDEIKYFFEALTSKKDTIAKKLKVLPLLKDISSFFPKHQGRRGACQEVVETDIDIFKLPVLKCWPFDGGKFITLPMVNTLDPETGQRNIGMYRVQLLDKALTALHWHKHKTGAAHYNKYKALGKKMPVAVVLGGDPVYTYCATAPLPEGIDEYLLAGFLRKSPVKLVKCLTQPEIEVPSDADFVIEGYVDTAEDLVLEGPFGDHTGFYSLADYYPKFHITAITHKKNAIYPATIVGIPPMEDAYIGLATEKIFTFPIKMAFVPEMKQLHMPMAGVQHNIVLVKIQNLYDGGVLKVKNALWGAGQMMFNKILCVYDGDRELTDYQEFLKDALKNFSPERDVYIERAGVSDVLDHASKKFALGGKICLDFTAKPTEDFVIKHVDTEKLSKKYTTITNFNVLLLGKNVPVVFITVKDKTIAVKDIAETLSREITAKIIVFIDVDLPDNEFLHLTWYASGNIDPGADCYVINNVLCVDSTAKTLENDGFTRQWPEPVLMNEETVKKVNEKKCVKKDKNLLYSPSDRLKSLRGANGAVKFFNSDGQ
jgi:4-hydroxy-3-polyprenylbenzoate decarboxylase